MNISHEDCQVHCNKWATETNKRVLEINVLQADYDSIFFQFSMKIILYFLQMVTESGNRAADKTADFIIIPLHSPDDDASKDRLPHKQPHSTDNSNHVEASAIKTIENSATTTQNIQETSQPREVQEKTRRKCSFQLDDKG